MLAQNEMFKDAVSRLNKVYKDDKAKLEAVNLTAKIAMEAFGDINRLSGPIGSEMVSSRPSIQHNYGTSTPTMTEPPKPIDPRAAENAQTAMLAWAQSDPVACQRWINETLTGAIERAAQQKFNNTMDEGGWQSAWQKALSGNAASDDAELKRAQEHADQAAAKKAAEDEKAARKANQQAAIDAERAWRENQKKLGKEYNERLKKEADERKRQYHQSILDKMDKEDEEYNNDREKLLRAGYDPEIWSDTKSRSWLTNRLRGFKRWWHGKNSALKEAIERGDIAMIESIRAELLQFKSLCESYGYTVDEVIMG